MHCTAVHDMPENAEDFGPRIAALEAYFASSSAKEAAAAAAAGEKQAEP